MANFANTQDLVDINEIRDNTVLMKNGRLIHVVMVDGVNFALKSEEEQNLITYAYQNFLNGIDFPLQILIHSRKINIENYLERLEARQREEPSALLQSQIGEYREFIASFVKDNAIMEKIFFVMVPFSPSALPSSQSASGVFSFFKRGQAATDAQAQAAAAQETTLKENISQLQQRTDQVVSNVQTIGLSARQLTSEELAELFYNFYNPETIERKEMNLFQDEPKK